MRLAGGLVAGFARGVPRSPRGAPTASNDRPQPAPHYAEAFSPMPGRCFRLIPRGGQGPAHCPEPPTWRGSFCARNGRRYTVEACEGHRPS